MKVQLVPNPYNFDLQNFQARLSPKSLSAFVSLIQGFLNPLQSEVCTNRKAAMEQTPENGDRSIKDANVETPVKRTNNVTK